MYSFETDQDARPVQRLMGPFLRFAALESASSIVLTAATVSALVLANSGLSGSYAAFAGFSLGGHLGDAAIHWTLQEFVTNALMTFFFLLVGLEIKREFLIGQLSAARHALLPIFAALGGVLTPALIYWGLNPSGAAVRGWGIPIATDIAFALAVLVPFGARIPPGAKLFLLSVAVVDDIAGVLVIAIAYTETIHFGYLALALLIFLACLGLNRLFVVSLTAYLLMGVAMWFALLASGIHATLAGIALAITIPATGYLPADTFLNGGRARLEEFARAASAGRPVGRDARIHLELMQAGIKLMESPLDRMESVLHHWVTFLVLPLFAFVNAGVPLQGVDAASLIAQPAFYGTFLALLLGKPIGITLFSWLAVRSHIAELPLNVSWRQLHAVSWLGGIGFTVSIFIANLAFGTNGLYVVGRLAILLASTVAAMTGAVLLVLVTRKSTVALQSGETV